jgi:hypothetical protein
VEKLIQFQQIIGVFLIQHYLVAEEVEEDKKVEGQLRVVVVLVGVTSKDQLRQLFLSPSRCLELLILEEEEVVVLIQFLVHPLVTNKVQRVEVVLLLFELKLLQ